jgi:hypothetical protein
LPVPYPILKFHSTAVDPACAAFRESFLTRSFSQLFSNSFLQSFTASNPLQNLPADDERRNRGDRSFPVTDIQLLLEKSAEHAVIVIVAFSVLLRKLVSFKSQVGIRLHETRGSVKFVISAIYASKQYTRCTKS